MLDSVGSVAVENVVSQIDALACQQAQTRGMVGGRRLGPGVAGWSLTEQAILFTMLPAAELGVSLNPQCLMIPRKSASFIVGMGKELATPRERHPCIYCNLTTCPFRQVEEAPVAE